MKLLYKSLLFLMIFICSVGTVCATDTDNIVTDLNVNSNNEIVNDIEISNIDSDNVNNNVSNDNNNYCCGVIAFKEALKENISLEEAKKAVKTDINGSTSMQNLIDRARKYNLTNYPVEYHSYWFY